MPVKEVSISGFPGGPVVKNLLGEAGETGSIPDLARFHMLQGLELSLCTTTTEPVLLSPRTAATEPTGLNYRSPHALQPVLRNKRSHYSEKPSLQLENSPHSPQLKKSPLSNKDSA